MIKIMIKKIIKIIGIMEHPEDHKKDKKYIKIKILMKIIKIIKDHEDVNNDEDHKRP